MDLRCQATRNITQQLLWLLGDSLFSSQLMWEKLANIRIIQMGTRLSDFSARLSVKIKVNILIAA